MKRSFVLITVVVVLAAVWAAPPPPQSIQFRDATTNSGIRFTHRSTHTADKFLIETMGSGVACLDYDLDGLTDVFFLNGARTVRTADGISMDKSEHRPYSRWNFHGQI
jgi:hypothetical protein